MATSDDVTVGNGGNGTTSLTANSAKADADPKSKAPRKRSTKKSTPKGSTKKTAKKTTKAKKAEKRTSPKRVETKAGALSGRQIAILEALKLGKPTTRNQIKEATGMKTGLYKLMGAPTLEGFGSADEATALEPRGLIKSEKFEGQRAMVYTITAKGKKALEEAKAVK